MLDSMARSLEPELRAACAQRLGSINWVRMDWQHGGALTGTSTYREPSGTEREVFIKFPVPGRELRWFRRLQTCGSPSIVPALVESGEALGAHDIAWLVMERLPGMPLGAHWREGNLRSTAHAGARLQACASAVPIDRPKRRNNWELWLQRTRRALVDNVLPGHQRWEHLLDRAEPHWERLIALWRSRQPIGWVHGDLHLGNAMHRGDGTVCLVDLGEIRPGHWLEDALYLERMYWAYPERLQAEDPLESMRAARSELGCDNGDRIEALANARRILLAATTPTFLTTEGGRTHLEACLKVFEDGLEWWCRNESLVDQTQTRDLA
ncbi:MAG: aminoglycoside phosphotransferase family protein [Planctomycetota bacterium]|nr:aminoglycoside phosphotransferase family protein [Planctomycetota bacterium]